MKEDRKVEDAITLHKSFWRMENHEPVLSVNRYLPLRKDKKIPLSDGHSVSDGVYLHPDLIDPNLFIKGKHYSKSSMFRGDFIEVLAPYDLCWTQAFIGCPIRVSSGNVWAEPFLKELMDMEPSSLKVNNDWMKKLLEFTRTLVEFARGRYPVVQPLFRGPIDMAASAIGPEGLCVAAYRHPEQLKMFLEFCTQTFTEALNAQFELTPMFHGGYGCSFGLWAPKPICRDQADHSVLVSPQLYERFFLPYDLKIIDAFDYTVFHLHSATTHIAEALSKAKNLSAIQVSIDFPAKAFSPPVEELLPIFKKIQKSKPLIISGPVTDEEMDLLTNELSPNGLALQISRLR